MTLGVSMSLRFAVAAVIAGRRDRVRAAIVQRRRRCGTRRGRRCRSCDAPSRRPPRGRQSRRLRGVIDKPFTGDFDGMVGATAHPRGAVPFNRTFYFVDQGTQRGLSYEYLMMYEEALNKKLKTGHLASMSCCCRCRRRADSGVARGRHRHGRRAADGHAGNERAGRFTISDAAEVNEVVVTGPGVPPINRSKSCRGVSSSCGGRRATTTA